MVTAWAEQLMSFLCVCMMCMWCSNLYDRAKLAPGNAVGDLMLLELADR